jgi:hypothetical protein
MKASIITKMVAALAIAAALPLGAIAEPPTLTKRDQQSKTMTGQGVIQNVKAEKAKPKKKASGKHYFARNWLET